MAKEYDAAARGELNINEFIQKIAGHLEATNHDDPVHRAFLAGGTAPNTTATSNASAGEKKLCTRCGRTHKGGADYCGADFYKGTDRKLPENTKTAPTWGRRDSNKEKIVELTQKCEVLHAKVVKMSTDGATKEEVEKVEKELAGTIKVRTSSPSSSASNSSSRPRVTTAALESLAGHPQVAVKELKSKNTTAATCTLACAQAVAGDVLATTSNADVVADTGAGVTVINPSNKRPTNVRVTDPAASISRACAVAAC